MATMSVPEREDYLADVHYAVLSVADPGGRVPLQTVVGYLYEPGGDLLFSTRWDSREMRRVSAVRQLSVLVLTERRPPCHVSFEGRVIDESPTKPEVHLALCVRYLGAEEGERHYQESRHQLDAFVTVRVRPERWRTYLFCAGEE